MPLNGPHQGDPTPLDQYCGSHSRLLSHGHNLSINSITSIIEPTTPPTVGAKSGLWETSKLNNTLNLPLFNLDVPDFDVDKENQAPRKKPRKIDKEYLASIGKVPLAQLRPEVVRLAKDQYGCRFLQRKIDDNVLPNFHARKANFEVIFLQIQAHLYELIIDPFGNYLIQKLVDYCSEENLDVILETLQFNLFQISINQHGTRALQKVIDNLNNNHQLALLMKGLKPYIIDLIKDLNGNHVIQKILNKYPPEDCQFIYDLIIADLYVVATHKHGCCVLQKCLNHVNLRQLAGFAAKILSFEVFVKLINDQFGNYVLQYLISINLLDINVRVFANFVKYGIGNLCVLKFLSNVIEKFLKNCHANESKSLDFSSLKFNLTLHVLQADINRLINDPYGNYVVQTLIDVLINPQVSYVDSNGTLLPALQPLVGGGVDDSLQIQIIKTWFQSCKIVSSFGKRIQSKINTILNNSKPPKKLVQKSPYNMTANGEFIEGHHQNPTFHQQSHRQQFYPTHQPQSQYQHYQQYPSHHSAQSVNYAYRNTYAPDNRVTYPSHSVAANAHGPIAQGNAVAGNYYDHSAMALPNMANLHISANDFMIPKDRR